MRISDWSSDACSSDLRPFDGCGPARVDDPGARGTAVDDAGHAAFVRRDDVDDRPRSARADPVRRGGLHHEPAAGQVGLEDRAPALGNNVRSEEHTSELQSLMRKSYAVFCLKKKKQK